MDDLQSEPAQPPAAGVPTSVPSDAELAALGRSIRRALRRRGADAATADDVSQEAITRLLTSGRALDADARLPWSIVTAQNLLTDLYRRSARRLLHRYQFAGAASPPPQPEDVYEARQAAEAVHRVIASLNAQDRGQFLDHADGASVIDLARASGTTAPALAARMYRTRARLRLDYLLAVEQRTLSSEECRRVLLAVSASDSRRQRAAGVPHHIARCPDCAEMAEQLRMHRHSEK